MRRRKVLHYVLLSCAAATVCCGGMSVGTTRNYQDPDTSETERLDSSSKGDAAVEIMNDEARLEPVGVMTEEGSFGDGGSLVDEGSLIDEGSSSRMENLDDGSDANGIVLDAGAARSKETAVRNPEGPCLAVGTPNPSFGATERASSVSPETVDWIQFGTSTIAVGDRFFPDEGLRAIPLVKSYGLSDGSSFRRGTGDGVFGNMQLEEVERPGDVIRYRMSAPDVVVQYSELDSGDHRLEFQLEGLGDISVRATYRATVGEIEGEVLVTVDDPGVIVDERFHYLSAGLCSAVPFVATIELLDGAMFEEGLFDSAFSFRTEAYMDFTLARP